MKKNKIIFISMFFLFLIILSLYFDSEFVKVISLTRNNFLNDVFNGIIFFSSEIVIFIFFTGLFLLKKNSRKQILPLWLTMFLSALLGFILKIAIQRQRPFQLGLVSILDSLEKNSHLIWNFAFPSFHAMLAFCVVPLLSKEFPKLKYIWLTFACLVALSRVYFGLHFLSDIIAGGVIGYLIGALVIKIEKENRFGEKIYNKIFRK